jgi:exosome complex component RRP42
MKKRTLPTIEDEHIRYLAFEKKRLDDRKFDEFRTLEFEVNPIGAAEGSARVKLGNTDLLVGVKMSVGVPYPDKPDEGVLMTGAELKQMAHPTFDGGPPSQEAVEIARVVDRGIRESQMIDTKDLCITPGEEVWMLFVDIQVIDFDGNIIDTATLGALLALHNTTVPAIRFGKGEDHKLKVNDWPVATTLIKINNQMMFDPTAMEEAAAEARFTVSTDENNDIRAMQKGLSGVFTYSEVGEAVDNAARLSLELRKKIMGE